MKNFTILLLTSVLGAAPIDQNFAQSQQQNAEQLKKYSWKSRTEIRKENETKAVQLNLMRYDLDGRLQKTLLSSMPQQQLPSRGLRGRIAQKKKEDFVEMLSDLETLARSYGDMSPD